MSPPPRLTNVLRLGEVSAEVAAQATVRRHASALLPFAELVTRFGKAAVADVLVLSRALHAPVGVLTDSALEEGWAAARRLLEMARKVPDQSARIRAGLDVQRSMMALLSRQEDLTVTWTEAISAAIKEGRAEAAAQALKLIPTLAQSGSALTGAKVLARLSADLPGLSGELRSLWAVIHQTLPQTDPALLKAAALAAERAAPIRALLRQRGSAAARRLALWGHVSGVRGAFGEAHGLLDPKYLGIVNEEYLRALKLAAQLGPGYEVRYLTQSANQLMLNGREGPDAVLTLVNQAAHEMIDVTRAQVKTARIAENAEQHVNDVWRLIGEERAAANGMPATYTFTIDDGDPQTFSVVMRTEVVPRIILINPAGSRIPGAQLDMLGQLGLAVDEVRLPLSVKQYTHLTISMIESAIKSL